MINKPNSIIAVYITELKLWKRDIFYGLHYDCSLSSPSLSNE